jgi:hypothetical protein
MNEEHPQRLLLLCELTNTEPEEWEPTKGPDSGMGIDSYYTHTHNNKEAWINEDHDYITITCDETTLFEGEIQELEADSIMEENLY